jgi:hypothetical protein
MAIFDEATVTMGGKATTTIEKPKSRDQKIEEWRDAHRTEYNKVCDECTCTPTRAQALMFDAWDSPPVD